MPRHARSVAELFTYPGTSAVLALGSFADSLRALDSVRTQDTQIVYMTLLSDFRPDYRDILLVNGADEALNLEVDARELRARMTNALRRAGITLKTPGAELGRHGSCAPA
ncbi:DNA-binding response OmpR family regulator [Deinobacterium chartae]|uniref:DNA-binding response OmpR family regulator n=1 Tax=Deinobacterium chartae TaxID=521158 RepID=A0A841I360_9DEIO|nr:hypothetical protein [Deinobacterium chartae]MBB6098798.1 DNA-binding response OmpR family regulator [Deinobacterium chartae]